MGSVRWLTVVRSLPSTASTLLGSARVQTGELNSETKPASLKLSSAPESTCTRSEREDSVSGRHFLLQIEKPTKKKKLQLHFLY